jgi:hypothetical protein
MDIPSASKGPMDLPPGPNVSAEGNSHIVEISHAVLVILNLQISKSPAGHVDLLTASQRPFETGELSL